MIRQDMEQRFYTAPYGEAADGDEGDLLAKPNKRRFAKDARV